MTGNLSKSVSLTAGKGMSQMAGLNPHTFQISDPLFFLGNTGFIRDFIRVNWDINKNMKFGYETTSSGDNNGTHLSGANHGVRFDWMQGDHHVGVAHKTGTGALKDAHLNAGFVNDVDYSMTKVFYAGKFGKLGFNFEYYNAINGGNVTGTLAGLNDTSVGGLLTAALNNGKDVEESGYWASIDYNYGKGHVHVGIANANIDNHSDVSATNTIETNADTWFGADYEIASNMDLFVEYHQITTTRASDASGSFMEVGFIRNF
jgi:hypothetical protein